MIIANSKTIIQKLLYEPRVNIRKRHTVKRFLNFIIIRIQLALRTTYVFGFPYALVVESTNICNLRCPLCPTGQKVKGRAKGKLSFSNFKKIMDEIGDYLYSIRLENWGEPLLNEEIFQMIAYAGSKKIITSFNTNLNFFNENYAQELIRSGLDHIKISLDAATQETYSKYRVGGDFNKVIDNIKLLVKARDSFKEKKPFIEIQFIVMRHNENEIKKFEELVRVIGADGFLIENLRLDMRKELFYPDPHSIEEYSEWLPIDDKYSIFDYEAKRRKKLNKLCSYLWTTAVINWDGAIVPCCSIYDEQYDFGNYFKNGFLTVWNGPKYFSARKLFNTKSNSYDSTACGHCVKKGYTV